MTATEQVHNLATALNAAFVRKADAEATVESANKDIVAIRNVLAGVGIGQDLQKEMIPAVAP